MGKGKGKGAPSNAQHESGQLSNRMRQHARRMRRKPEADDRAPASGDTQTSAPPPVPDPPKYLLIEVPNFNNAAAESEAMSSYLRLGTVPDLAIAGLYDAPKATGEDLAAHATFFLDDDRKRDGSPGFVSEADRQAETAKLHTKGGWRDHSDGNRITTTRGDKVEVIRGNYKLIVLNRQDDPIGAAGWDASGGHIEGLGISSAIEWVEDSFNGTWRVVESSEKGDTITTQHGNSVNTYFGDKQDSTTGSEDEQRWRTDKNGDEFLEHAPNPVITSKTWARRIETQTGSAVRPVPVISDQTWADSISSKTQAGSITDTTIGNRESVTLGAVTDLTLGNMLSATIGGVQDVTIGALMELTLGLVLEMSIGGTMSVNIGPSSHIDLLSRTSLTPQKAETAGTITRNSAVETAVTGVYKVTAAMILLG